MHRTGNVGTLNSKPAEVNGTKPKSLRTSPEMPHRQKKSRARNNPLLDSRNHLMGVFSNDFAAVDFREELCYHSRPEKAKFKRYMEQERKPMKESHARRETRSRSPKRFSGDGSAPPRFLFGFPCCSGCPFRGVCLAAAARSAAALVYAKHTSRCQINFLLIKAIKKAYKY